MLWNRSTHSRLNKPVEFIDGSLVYTNLGVPCSFGLCYEVAKMQMYSTQLGRLCDVDFVHTEQVRVLNKRPIFVTKCLNVLIEPAADIDSDHFAAEVLYDNAGVSIYTHTTSRHK
jgi:hypothetical protein